MRCTLFALAISAAPALADGCDDLKKEMKATADLGSTSLVASTDLLMLTATQKMPSAASEEVKRVAEELLDAIEDFNQSTQAMRKDSDCF